MINEETRNVFNEENLEVALNTDKTCYICEEPVEIFGTCNKHFKDNELIKNAKKSREILGIEI